MADVIMADVEAAGWTTSGNARPNKRKQNDSRSEEVSADYGPSIWSDIFEDDSDGREEIERMAEVSVHDLRRAKRLKNNDDRVPDHEITADEAIIDFQDVKDITIRRSTLAKWCTEPYFGTLIAGCFVRIGIGKSRSSVRPINYKLCLVMNVDATDPDSTYKYLNCVWGSAACRWEMATASESRPSPDEFYQWLHETSRTGGHIPTKQDLIAKKQDISKIKSFMYSAATVVKQMSQEKNRTMNTYDPFSRRWTRSSSYYRPKREDHRDCDAIDVVATAAIMLESQREY